MSNEKYLAIDVGGTSIKYTITDRNAKITKIDEIQTIRQPEKLFESLDEIISPRINQIAGIAMSFPGKINVEKGIVNIIAIYRGSNESAGEISSILTDFKNLDTEKRFGKVAGHKSLTDAYKGTGDIDSFELFERYRKGDERAREAIRNYSRTIAAGIVTIQAILDVERFCIGGGISAQDILIAEIKKSVNDFFKAKSSEAINEPEIERCRFKNASGCVGAIYNFLTMEKIL